MPKRNKANEGPKDAEDAFESAVKLEEQAERYRFGDKAYRNLLRAEAMYATAHSMGSTDALYNQARVLQTLATNYLPKESAVETLQKALMLYRAALELDASSHDVIYNLALALIDYGEMVHQQESISFQEARTLLLRLIQLQESSLVSQPLAVSPSSSAVIDQDDDPSQEDSTQVEETFTVVPSTLIETLLIYVQLLNSSMSSDVNSLPVYEQEMRQTFRRAQELDAANHYDQDAIQQAQANATLTLSELSYATNGTIDLAVLRNAVDTLANLSTQQPGNLELLADYADGLVITTSLLHIKGEATYTAVAQEAISQYQKLIQAISSPLSSKQTPAQSIPLIKSSAYCQCSFLHILLGNQNQGLESAVKAIEATEFGIYFDHERDTFGKKAGGRTDRSAEMATWNAALTFTRATFHASSSQQTAINLLAKLQISREEMAYVIGDEFEGDALWSEAEATFWRNLQ